MSVIEAGSRIGGRINDDESLGVCVGKGAQVLNACRNNPLSTLVHQVVQFPTHPFSDK